VLGGSFEVGNIRLLPQSAYQSVIAQVHPQRLASNALTPNHSLNMTRSGHQRMAAPGAGGFMLSAAKRLSASSRRLART